MAVFNQATETARSGKIKTTSKDYKNAAAQKTTTQKTTIPAGTTITIAGGGSGKLIADGSGGWVNTNNTTSNTNTSTNKYSDMLNSVASQQAKLAAQNATSQLRNAITKTVSTPALVGASISTPAATTTTTPKASDTSGNNVSYNANSGSSYSVASPTVQAIATPTIAGAGLGADPYAEVYALYDQLQQAQEDALLKQQNALAEQKRAQEEALAQQKAARLSTLQANYNNAKSKLDSSFNSGETELNQNADEALRQAYINSQLNQKRLNQQLASMGITGGALESILANAYNTYGNNRNAIERDRADQLRTLLANYQGTLGDIENSYLAGQNDTDSDYSGSIADALTGYYDKLANLQQQIAANQYQTALGKANAMMSGTSQLLDYANQQALAQQKAANSASRSVGTSASTSLNKNISTGLKNFKDNIDAAKSYLDYMGVPEDEQADYLWNAGFDLSASGQQAAAAEQQANALASIPTATRSAIVQALKRVYPTTAQDGLSSNDSLYRNVINELNKYAKQYGLSDAQAQAILAEAGF